MLMLLAHEDTLRYNANLKEIQKAEEYVNSLFIHYTLYYTIGVGYMILSAFAHVWNFAWLKNGKKRLSVEENLINGE